MNEEVKGIGIHIKTANFEQSKKFYDSLGFKAVFSYGPDSYLKTLPEGLATAPEKYRGITYEANGSKLELAEDHIGIPRKEVFQEKIKSPKVSAMINVDSLVPLFSNPLVDIKFPVCHYYWGTIEAVFRDPDGFVLVFIAPYSEAEFNKISQLTKVEVVKPS